MQEMTLETVESSLKNKMFFKKEYGHVTGCVKLVIDQ